MGKISLSSIAEELAVRNGLTREAADSFMHAFVETIEKGLLEDGMVKVKGLGTFRLQEVSDRGSVDVNTGERITIKGYRKVTFTPDSAMKELVNRPFAHFEPTELNDGYPTEEELVTSNDIAADGEDGEVAEEKVEADSETSADAIAEEFVEAVAEEAAELVEETQETVVEGIVEAVEETTETEENEALVAIEEIAETAEVAPVVEVEMKEDVPGQEEVLARETAPKQEHRKRRGCGCWITSLVLLAFASILAFTFGWFTLSDSEESRYEDTGEEHSDIVVKPNLEEELGAMWGDEPKVKPQLPAEKKEAPAISAIPSETVVQAAQQTAGEMQDASLPVVAENAKSQMEESKKPVVETCFSSVTLTESLKAKPIKDITPADTTDYVMDGTRVVHTLKSGETIIQLANKYYGDKRLWPYIVKYNRMRDFNNVAIGQRIEIPVLKVK